MEDGEEEEMKEEEEEEEEEEKSEKVVQLWSPEKFQRDYTTSDPSATCGLSRKVTGPEGHTNDRTSTFGPPRNPTDPSTSGVTAEPIDPNRCVRPLQRARERRSARLKEGSHADAEFDPDPHVPRAKLGSQRSSVLSAWEQERVYLRCDRCNNKLTDSDWSRFKSEGWDFETVKHLREVQRPLRLRCSPCARALAQSTRPTSSLT